MQGGGDEPGDLDGTVCLEVPVVLIAVGVVGYCPGARTMKWYFVFSTPSWFHSPVLEAVRSISGTPLAAAS